jgi:gamma-glutamyl phosphate reductase
MKHSDYDFKNIAEKLKNYFESIVKFSEFDEVKEIAGKGHNACCLWLKLINLKIQGEVIDIDEVARLEDLVKESNNEHGWVDLMFGANKWLETLKDENSKL